jgi:DNA-binding NarL/FixJ family response regulator
MPDRDSLGGRTVRLPEPVLDTIETLRIRLVAVDPHPLVRWALAQICAERSDLTLVGEAAGADEAGALCYAVRPDVVLIDDSLPNDDAWRLAGNLRTSHPNLGIVILSASNTDQGLFRALNCGASAFISKSAPVADVVAALRAAALAPASFSAAGLAAALRRRQQTSERMALSPRERQILFLLRDGLSVPEIAGQLFVSLSTAKTYVTRLYDKLNARNRAQALMTAVRLGLFEDGFAAAAPHAVAG